MEEVDGDGGLGGSRDASNMWDMTTNYIREVAREVLGVLRGNGGHRGNWWWNGVVQRKMEVKKVSYMELVYNKAEEEKRAKNEWYRAAKLVVTMAKTSLLMLV